MQNVEIKAKYPDLEKGRGIAREIGAKFEKNYHQTDTYFNVLKGRFKLREFETEAAQLIFYQRPNQTEVKLSEYHIYPVGDPSQLKVILQASLGVWQVVEKWRDVFWYDEVRIHLDRVQDLGTFLEFEGLLSQPSDGPAVEEKVKWLIGQFGIPVLDLIDMSYSDMKLN